MLYEKIPSQSLRLFKSKFEKNKSDANMYGLALSYANNNNFNESLNLLDALISKYPKNLFLNTTKIEILTKAQKFDEALGLSNRFLEISPKNYPLTITKSKLLLEMDRFFESE